MISDIGFVGFGLIAGSIAKAIRLKHPDFNIYVYNRNAPKVKDSLKLALSDGTVNELYSDLDSFSYILQIFKLKH